MKQVIIILFLILLDYFASAQPSFKFIKQDSLTIPDTNIEDVFSIKKQEGRFWVSRGQTLFIYTHNGEIANKITFKERKNNFWGSKTNKRFIYELSLDYYKTHYVDMSTCDGGYLTLSNDSGYATYKAKILPDKKWHNFKYEGHRIQFSPNPFSFPPLIFWQHYFIISPWVTVFRTSKDDSSFEHEFEELDTLAYLSFYPDLILYDAINMPAWHYIRKHWVKKENNKDIGWSLFLQDEKGKRLRFKRNIIVQDGFRQRYFALARQNKYMLEPYMNFFAFDSIGKLLYFGRLHQEQITVLTLEGKVIKSFGKRGQHLSESDTLHFVEKEEFLILTKEHNSKPIKDKYLAEKHNLSPLYHAFKYDAVSNKTYRLYQKPLPYTTEEYRKLFWNDPEKRDSLRLTRPTYLQIYDHNDGDKLIYDERVPAPFHILEVKGDTLWAVAGVTDKGLKIVKYILKKE